uniref:Uncharacterized protein n=1 Tax=Arundo donax TaxID=35708 RepID=A0A0A8Y5A5_ARUDO
MPTSRCPPLASTRPIVPAAKTMCF